MEFEPTEVMKASFEKESRAKMKAEWEKMKENINAERQEIAKQKEQQAEEIKRQIEEEKKKMTSTLTQELRKSMDEEYKTRIDHDQKVIAEKNLQIEKARQMEIENLTLKQQVADQKQDTELKVKQAEVAIQEKLKDSLRKEEEERSKLKDQEHQLKVKELEKQLEDQRKLAEEMKRKAEQGSMQTQGEVQELALEELLRSTFPYDIISEVGKGVRGADCIQTVRSQYGNDCGKIIYESKRTKDFSKEWIEKLKADMLSNGADVAVIVTQAMPKDMEQFGQRDGVWICTFMDVKALAYVLREGIIKVAAITKAQDNRGDKMQMLYQYLTSQEFSSQWSAIREGYMAMRQSIQKEREAMEKLWKSREKQLDKILLNAAGIKGSIEGIAGMEVDLNLISEGDSYLIE
jgi:hypothetical protein